MAADDALHVGNVITDSMKSDSELVNSTLLVQRSYWSGF